MKRTFTILITIISAICVFAQSPDKMSYQAVVRNSNNALVTSQKVGMMISILQGSASGTLVYSEIQVPTTNLNGLVTLEIGTGTVVYGDFSAIDWANGSYFISTEIDPAGGTNYSITGVSQLLSVPYALYSNKSGNGFSGNYSDLTNRPNLSDTSNYIKTELDPIFSTSIAKGIQESDTVRWNAKSNFSGSYTDLSNKPKLYTDTTNQLQGIEEVLQLNNNANQKSIKNVGNISFNNDIVNDNAAIDLSNCGKTFILPRFTTAQRDLLAKTEGMLIYNVDVRKFQGVVLSTDTVLDAHETNGVGTGWFIDEDSLGFGMYSSSNLAQTFMVSNSGKLSKISVNMAATFGTLPQNIKLILKTGGSPSSGDILLSKTISINTDTYKWYDIDINEPIVLTSGNTYTLIAEFAECGLAEPFRRVDWQRNSDTYSLPEWTGNNYAGTCPITIDNYESNYGYSWLYKIFINTDSLIWVDLH